MKLLTMKKISEGDYIFSEDEASLIDYMVKLETDGEEDIYNTFGAEHVLFQSMLGGMREHIADKEITDEDVAYYFMASEQEPEVGGTFELDDMEWERVR